MERIYMWFDVILITILGICIVTDVRSRKIYNKVIFPGLIIAFASHLIIGGWQALGGALLGFSIGLGLLLIPYLLGGMGAGDVKLLALIGALKGSVFVLDTAIYMAILGAVIALVVLLCRRGVRERSKSLFYFLYGLRYGVKIPLGWNKAAMSATYPYGVAIAGGAVMSLFLEGWIIQ
jgi:prepilin peptidase CpaA